MTTHPEISFDNTEFAFEHKTTAELKKARFLFSAMAKPWLVQPGIRIIPWAVRVGLPVKTILRNTIFAQFVGGESLEETNIVTGKLNKYNVKAILDYGVEGGHEGEKGFDEAGEVFIKVIDHAATQQNTPFMSIKMTGVARFDLLEKLHALMNNGEGTLMKRYSRAIGELPEEERKEWERVQLRLMRIGKEAEMKNIGVMVDAEDSWIQDPVDALTIMMMDTFNKKRCVVYNTIQLYRHDRLQFLKDSHQAAIERDFILGSKLVRGAYMEKERKRAQEMGYPSPIQPDKAATDRDYDAGVRYCLDHIDRIALIVASHNENSNLLTTQIMREKGLPADHHHVHFSQLYGMSDNITFNLAHAGFSVSKYLPFGPIKDVIPYLMRRAQENTSVGGQTSRELSLIRKELTRRKLSSIN